ncbi:MAG: Hsp33 family molecular chaperone HslO [Verrucomicrobiae bacterium]|nr:Hsp33 family molecular chaperone HslO [Verrucomicrobiae bacterium]
MVKKAENFPQLPTDSFERTPTSAIDMPDETTPEDLNEATEVRCYFVRNRNALAVRANFESLYVDYYLHLMEHRIRHEPGHDALLKDGLAALTLHLASRPRNEAAAWTIHLANPSLNLFVTGSNRNQNVTGRIFSENVRETDRNLFFSQTTADGLPARQSTIEFEDADIFSAVEAFYRQSEQRPARYFRHDEEDFVMVTAQPDCDMPWFLTLDDDSIRKLDETEELSLLERRLFRFECGCDIDRIYPVIASMSEATIDEIFAGEGTAIADCPRCGAHYDITREGLREFRRPG